jgi:hypothetical protein
MLSSELSARVAQQVMGWTTRPFSSDGWTGIEWLEPTSVPGVSVKRYLPPDYSTDIAAAWPLVEKLNLTVEPWKGIWKVTRWDRDGSGRFALGETAPEAICRAALEDYGA